uniref:trichohyalin-like n=1 Tax=Osmia lignaria TaxID=473952 RepID=UPI001478FB5A|nr:trichohyalin-like [Osmia lignaria]
MEKDPTESPQDTVSSTHDFLAKLRRSSRNRESYDDLTNLESELRRAYMSKELETQLLERQTERYIQNIRKQRTSKQQLLDQQAVHEEDLQRQISNQKKSSEYRAELTSQMEEKEEEKKMMMEEARIEREVLTEVDRIREYTERSRAEETKMERMETMKREYLIHEEMKEIRRQEDMEAEAIKLEEDQQYLKELDERKLKMKQLLQEQHERREKIILELGRVLMCKEMEKREREILMIELVTEDLKRELMIKDEEERARRQMMREELANDLQEQIIFTEECKMRFVEQDKAFAEEIMKNIMENERIARLTYNARKRMQAQYKDDLARLIETRRIIRQREICKMEEEAKDEGKREKKKLEMVHDERKRLLEQHVKNISEFIDKAALTQEEMRIVNKP